MGIDRAEVLAALDLAHAQFGERLAGVTDAAWNWPTPCTEWNVIALVDHVRSAAEIYTAISDGVPFVEAMAASSATIPPGRLPGAVDSAASRLRAALSAPGALARRHPCPGGKLSGADLAVLRVFDVTVHTWDLARATGQPEELHPDTVSGALRYASRHLDADHEAGSSLDRDATTISQQRRLLELAGRSP